MHVIKHDTTVGPQTTFASPQLRKSWPAAKLASVSLASVRRSASKLCQPVAFLRTPLLQLARKRRFDELMTILNTNDNDMIACWLDDCAADPKVKGGSALHVVLQYKPPAQAVRALANALTNTRATGKPSSPEDHVDNAGRTPLHIAAMAGADVEVVQRLLTNGTAAATTDEHQCTPLHYAVQQKLRNEDVVHLLIRAYPQARSIPDERGRTPLDIARKRKRDQTILCALVADKSIGSCCTHVKNDELEAQVESSTIENSSAYMTPEIPSEISRAISMDNVSLIDDEHLFVLPAGENTTPRRPGKKKSNKKRRQLSRRKRSHARSITSAEEYESVEF